MNMKVILTMICSKQLIYTSVSFVKKRILFQLIKVVDNAQKGVVIATREAMIRNQDYST